MGQGEGFRIPEDPAGRHGILVFAYGNPSRGDDALGPQLIERLEARRRSGGLPGVELLTDFQLQVEHALDLVGKARVIFADAGVTTPEPFDFAPLGPAQDASYTTHAMSPQAVLRVFEQIMCRPPPPAWLLAIRGYSFELGSPLSPAAAANLAHAERFLLEEIRAKPQHDSR